MSNNLNPDLEISTCDPLKYKMDKHKHIAWENLHPVDQKVESKMWLFFPCSLMLLLFMNRCKSLDTDQDRKNVGPDHARIQKVLSEGGSTVISVGDCLKS